MRKIIKGYKNVKFVRIEVQRLLMLIMLLLVSLYLYRETGENFEARFIDSLR